MRSTGLAAHLDSGPSFLLPAEASSGCAEALPWLRNRPAMQLPSACCGMSSVTPSCLDFCREARGRFCRDVPRWAELPEQSGQLRAVRTPQPDSTPARGSGWLVPNGVLPGASPAPASGPRSASSWGLPPEFLSPWLPLVERASCSEKRVRFQKQGCQQELSLVPAQGPLRGNIVLRQHHQGAQERRARRSFLGTRLGAAAKVSSARLPTCGPHGRRTHPPCP